VVRNLLGLLAELPTLPIAFDLWQFLKHGDSRVRREAMRLLLRESDTRARAIVTGLRDADDHIVRLVLTAATERCPDAAVPLVITRATAGANADQRVAAIRVLAATGQPSALSTLLQLTALRRRFFGEKPPPKTPEYLAALAGLQRFADDPRARDVLALAARSRDADVARASRAFPGGDE
jgi:HEAT repeat protein